jgi:hypothetical protein
MSDRLAEAMVGNLRLKLDHNIYYTIHNRMRMNNNLYNVLPYRNAHVS